MPEGDSIHNLATRLARVLVGRAVKSFSSHVIPDDVARSLVGRAVTAVDAKGKNLLVRFDDGRSLHVHLRMLGRINVTPARLAASRARLRERQSGRASAAPQLRIEIGDVVVTGLRIPVLRLLTASQEARSPDLAGLGPDLIDDAFDEGEAIARLRTLGDKEIGEALLVQRALAGIGNIYKSETLFLEKIDPTSKVARSSDDQLRALVRRARKLLRANLGPGPRRTRSSLTGPTLWVYERAGKPCLRCGTPIMRIVQGAPPGRSTYHCPACQS